MILSWVMVQSEAEKSLKPMYEGLAQRYSAAGIEKAQYQWVDRDCCAAFKVAESFAGEHLNWDSWKTTDAIVAEVTSGNLLNSCALRSHFNANINIKLDLFHCMRRFLRECVSEHHTVYSTFAQFLSAAFSVVDQEDLQRIKEAYAFCGILPANPTKQHIREHCRIRIPLPEELIKRAAPDSHQPPPSLSGRLRFPRRPLHDLSNNANRGCWLLGDLMCSLWLVLSSIIISSSFGTMVLISVDRYVAICHPLHYFTKVKPKRVQVCVCLYWMFAILFYTLLFKNNLQHPGRYNSCIGECVFEMNYIANIFDLIVTFIFPITVIVILHMKIFGVVVYQARAMRSHIAVVTMKVTAKKSEMKAARNLGVVVVVFLICV